MREIFRGSSVIAGRVWVTAAAVCGVVALGFAPVAVAAPGSGGCQEISIPVAIVPDSPPDNTVAATLCTPPNRSAAPEVDILVAGATYNREYWDPTAMPAEYSYVANTVAAGRATLNFDRLGTGASTRTGSDRQNVSTDAFVLHQLIGWLHGNGYRTVNAVGHSLGSVTLIDEASRWHDLERVVLTGVIHLPGVGLNSTGFYAALYPAMYDPKWQGILNDPGFLTTRPGQRGSAFYDLAATDSAIVANDERTKDLATVGEVAESSQLLLTPAAANPSRAITAPVLVAMGAEDDIFCNLFVSCHSAETIRANEAPYYTGAAALDVLVVPDAAHNLPLHRNAADTFRRIDHWIDTGTVGG
ncbi:alpha/beta fold hydrolase [Nocardia spumae]|uniref:alpha/beta fold hydrolase n=1 Tax=Nocardia spumae TaxID=2887190 RepID=UPI001D14B312|nr:alpha/beta fold hydrolase [Nocardia spumae]